ncbi:MAG: plasmid mobilization relaxosome protein MobC [Rhodopseudomonas sp.]|nr:plasmid mobilization relaxosome protein MobC [Rhodopseudomonas sp.]
MARPTPSHSRGDESRSEVITTRVTRAERVRLEQRAAAAGMTVSAYAAQVLARGQVTVETRPRSVALPPDLVAEFKRIGVNINQIAHALNAHKRVAEGQLAAEFADFMRVLLKDDYLKRKGGAVASALLKSASRSPR